MSVSSPALVSSRIVLFEDSPAAVHVSAGAAVRLQAVDAVELLQCETANTRAFSATIYLPSQTKDEHRGAGKTEAAPAA